MDSVLKELLIHNHMMQKKHSSEVLSVRIKHVPFSEYLGLTPLASPVMWSFMPLKNHAIYATPSGPISTCVTFFVNLSFIKSESSS
jgi:hypothetical protein